MAKRASKRRNENVARMAAAAMAYPAINGVKMASLSMKTQSKRKSAQHQ
jgi:hypothetical protein